MLLVRAFYPHLASVAATNKSANLFLVSSGLAFVPFGFYPVYCPTKAAIHSLALTLRQQLNFAPEAVTKNFSICEVVPPYVDTGLDAEHRERVNTMLRGQGPPPMKLDEYIEKTMWELDKVRVNEKMPKEIATGFSQVGVDAWRDSLGKVLEGMHIDC
jgi:short-subunit dehydrogenase involved in D-alanine esterification of teichoic acids